TISAGHQILHYALDVTQHINKPLVLRKHPWIKEVVGALNIIVFALMFINGWFLTGWTGVIILPIFCIFFSRKIYPAFRIKINPFYQVVLGAISLFITTAVNISI